MVVMALTILDQFNTQGYKRLVLCCEMLGDEDKVIEAYTAASSIDPDDFELLLQVINTLSSSSIIKKLGCNLALVQNPLINMILLGSLIAQLLCSILEIHFLFLEKPPAILLNRTRYKHFHY